MNPTKHRRIHAPTTRCNITTTQQAALNRPEKTKSQSLALSWSIWRRRRTGKKLNNRPRTTHENNLTNKPLKDLIFWLLSSQETMLIPHGACKNWQNLPISLKCRDTLFYTSTYFLWCESIWGTKAKRRLWKSLSGAWKKIQR
jgi:hypothetical protein